MKKIIKFSKVFKGAAVFSILLICTGIAGFVYWKDFNRGVDFKPGLIQEVQFAPTAFSITWSGRGNATISFDRNNLYIVNSGVGVEPRTLNFPFNEYTTINALTEAMMAEVEGLNVRLFANGGTGTQWLVRGAQKDPQLGSSPYQVHYLNHDDPQNAEIAIEVVREALGSLGQTVSVQSLGQSKDRHFMIRIEDKSAETAIEGADGAQPGSRATAAANSESITNALENRFGSGEVVILRSDYVGSRHAQNLVRQTIFLVSITLLLILGYSAIRFKLQYAVGAVIGIIHDGIVIIAFVVWTRMEFTPSTIAAILTILGYSTNNTIVVFDRIRENLRIYPDEEYVNILNRSLTETLNRTIITTLTTMLAVLSLLIFTTGSMRDFAIALQVGLISGVYTTTFIVTGIIYAWERAKIKKGKQKLAAPKAGTAKVAAKA